MRFVSSSLVAALVACVAPLAFAQPAPTGAPPATTPPQQLPPPSAPRAPAPAATTPPPAGAQTPTAPAGAAATGTAGTLPTIEVDDPLLAPVAAAPQTLKSFREVLTLLSNESLTVKIATAEIQRAEGQRRQALAAALPSLTGNASGTLTPYREIGCEPPDSEICQFQSNAQRQLYNTQASLRLSQQLSARTWYAVGTAEKTVDATKLRSEEARRTAIASVATAIVAVVTAERVAEINRVGLRAALQRLELTKRRKRLGSGTDLDIVRAEQDAASARSQIVTGDENLRRSRESLGQLFGKSDAYGVPTNFTLNDIEPALKSACTPGKVEDRTDVLAAKADLEVAKRQVTDVKLAFAPTVELSSTLSTSSGTNRRTGTVIFPDQPGGLPELIPGQTFSQQQSLWSITATLTVPIWDGGARYGQLKTASAGVEQAKARVEQATVTASVEATQAQRAVTVAEQAKAVSEKARDLARETARLSQVAFESGAGTSLDLVDSGRVLRQAELDLAVKELEVVRAKIAALIALSACKL